MNMPDPTPQIPLMKSPHCELQEYFKVAFVERESLQKGEQESEMSSYEFGLRE